VWHHQLSVDLNPGTNATQDLFQGSRRRKNLVLLRQSVSGVHDSVRDLAIIRKQQQSFCVPIQPPNREQPGICRQELHHGSPVTFIARRRDKAGRLVHHNVSKLLLANWLPVDTNICLYWINSGTEFGHGLAINSDATRANEILSFPSGGDPACGQDALQPLAGLFFRRNRRGH
jgi:hypothetical protein